MNQSIIIAQVSSPDETLYITGSLVAVVERLDDEFTKILQQADCHSTDYPSKLVGDVILVDIIDRARQYTRQQVDHSPSLIDLCRGRWRAVLFACRLLSDDKP